jgi:hypothetical protein
VMSRTGRHRTSARVPFGVFSPTQPQLPSFSLPHREATCCPKEVRRLMSVRSAPPLHLSALVLAERVASIELVITVRMAL